MKPRAIIFDIGGVLAYDVWEHLLFDDGGIVSLYGLDKETVNLVGAELWERFAHQISDNNNTWEKLERDYWQLFNDNFRLPLSYNDFARLTDKFIKPVNGMLKILDRLKGQNIELAICSNNTEFWYERQRKKFNFERYFDQNKIILSSRVGASKNDPDFKMFKSALMALGVENNECIFIDDREENISQALRFGITSILFPSHSVIGANYLANLFEKVQIF